MSPAIMFCGASDDGERFAGLSPVAKFFCPLWSFCLIVVLLGVGARDFSRSSFFQTENKRRALSRAPAVTRGNPRQLQRVRCSACSRLQC